MDYDLIVVKTLESVYKNYYYIIRGEFLLALVKQFADEITGNCDSKYHKCTFQNNMSYHLSFPPFPTTIYLWLISLTASKELSILLLKLLECR